MALTLVVDAVLDIRAPARSDPGLAITSTFRYVGDAPGVALLGSPLSHNVASC